MKQLLVILLLVLVGCARTPEEGVDIRLEHTPWTVEGTLVSESGQPVPGHEIEFLRVQGSSDGTLGAFVFASTKTDSTGTFFFSSNVAGTYTAIAHLAPPCIANVHLGELAAGDKRSVRIALNRSRDCRISL